MVVSFLCLAFSIIPWVVFGPSKDLRGLGVCLVAGFLPSALLGGTAGRLRGCAGSGGFAGGMLAAAVFIALRLEQIRLAAIADQVEALQFPRALCWLTALGWAILTGIIALLTVWKKEFPSDESRKQP